MRNTLAWLTAILIAAIGGQAMAQAFPAKPVRIIVAFPPGGGTDIVARLVGQRLADLWGQQVIVENRGGASGVIGTEMAARAAPDGYTIFMGTLGNLAVNQHLFPKMAVDPLTAFAPITQVVDVHFVLLANPALPVKNVNELLALARAKPGQLTYSSSGSGGAPHLAAELFKRLGKVFIVHIPYRGSAPSMQDVMGGQVSITFDSQIQALPFIKDNRLRAIAVLGRNRSQQLPDVPTVAESGLPDYDLTNWFGLVAPAATPKPLLDKLNADVVRVIAAPEFKSRINDMSATVVGNTQEQFAATMKADSAKWARVIRDTGLKAD
jgi:tripartite-type tricarboxylate transporter receptor subunit TctC